MTQALGKKELFLTVQQTELNQKRQPAQTNIFPFRLDIGAPRNPFLIDTEE